MAEQVTALSALLESQLAVVVARQRSANRLLRGPDSIPVHASLLTPTYTALDPKGVAPVVRIVPVDRPPTQAQVELLSLVRSSAEANRAYCETLAFELSGSLDRLCLEQAWAALIMRHEGMRLRVDAQGRFRFDAQPGPLRLIDWLERAVEPYAAKSDPAQAYASPTPSAQSLVAQALARPLSSKAPALVRAELHRLEIDRHLLVLTAHHLAADGWSLGLMLSELAELYNARQERRPERLERAAPWGDFLAWSLGLRPPSGGLSSEVCKPSVSEGSTVATDRVPPLLHLHGARDMKGFRGARIHLRNPPLPDLAAELTRGNRVGAPNGFMVRVRACARALGQSPVVLLLGAYAVFLARLSGQRRVGVGLPLAGHSLAGLPVMVGMASVVLPLDIRLDGARTFAEALNRVQEALELARKGATGLFAADPQVGFPVNALFNIDPGVRLELKGLRIEPHALPVAYVKTGMFFNLLELNGQLLLDFDCHEALANVATARLWLQGLLHLIGHACAQPQAELGALDLGPAQARPAQADLVLLDDFGGAAAVGLPARLCRLLPDGERVDLGRVACADASGQVRDLGAHGRYVRLGGRWADLGAAENALIGMAEVDDAVVLGERERTTAFVRLKPGAAIEPAGLDRQLRAVLAAACRPSAYVWVQGPVRDESGVALAASLHRLDSPRLEPRPKLVPRTELESRLLQLWMRVLGLTEPPGVTDDFFELGGHSLKAVMLANRVMQEEGLSLDLAAFFRSPTVAEMASQLQEGRQEGWQGGRSVEPIRPLPAGAPRLASEAQRRMWLLEHLDTGHAAYNMGFVLERSSVLSAEDARVALHLLTQRHEALRCAMVEVGGELLLQVRQDAAPVLAVHDLRGRDDVRHQAEVLREACVSEGFELARAPLWRACLIRAEDQGQARDALVVSMHHAIGDNWSIMVWVRDFLDLLAHVEQGLGGEPALKPMAIQISDCAAWHNRRLADLAPHLEHWVRHLRNCPEKLMLPTDRPRSTDRLALDQAGRTLKRRVDPATHEVFRELAREQGVSGFMLVTAVWRVWLWARTGARDAVVGTVHAGRDHPGLADQIGMYVNTLPLRLRLQPESSFLELLDEVRQAVVEAFAHADVPFNRIVEALPGVRGEHGHPLFDMVVAHDDFQDMDRELRAEGWTVAEVDVPSSPFELILTGSEDAAGMVLSLQYRTALFDNTRIQTWLQELEALIRRACRRAHEPIQRLAMPDEVQPPPASKGVVANFEAWRRRQPQAPAVLGTTVRTYEELGQEADAVARRLLRKGCGPQRVVAVIVDRQWDLPVAVLGVMKSRAAFVLLDPAHPVDRLAYIVRDAGCLGLLHSRGQAELARRVHERVEAQSPEHGSALERWPVFADCSAAEVAPGVAISSSGGAEGDGVECSVQEAASGDDLAYLIYTSGSTGEPKGVLVDHAAVADHLEGITPLTQWSAQDRSLLFATVAVDAVIEQLLLPLVNGAAFAILDPERYSPQGYVQAWKRWGASILDVPPVFWGELIAWCQSHPEEVRGLSVKTLMTGGEEMTVQRVAGWYGLPLYCAQVLNLFGPTETTCSPVVARIGPHLLGRARMPIGFPVGRRRVRVVDGQGNDVPLGDDGELWLGAACVARGYLHRPELTAERFLLDVQGQRWYRTGDRVRQRADGELEFLGRIDRQFKLRGFRIEPGEIEDALRRCPGVQDAAVTMEAGEDGDQLWAWLVSRPGEPLERSRLVAALGAILPAHMVPSRLRCISHLPLSRTEKLDRAALHRMDSVDLWDAAPQGVTAGEPGAVARLCALVAQVVGVPSAKPTDNFFAIGGHSLKAIQVVARVREQFGVEIGLKDVFSAPTLTELADIVSAGAAPASSRITPVPRDSLLPASAGQTRLWMLQSQQPGSVAFNMVAAFDIQGPLDVPALQAACSGVVSRHEVLRTTLGQSGGQLVQRVQPVPQAPVLPIEQVPTAASLEEARQAELRRPFRLEAELPIRLRLLAWPGGHGLVINVHHVAFDGWSATVLLDDLSALYAAARLGAASLEQVEQGQGGVAGLDPLQIQYADYAHWQRTHLPDEQRRYWLSQFEGVLVQPLRLPTDYPRPEQPSGSGAMVMRTFGAHTSQDLRALAAHEGVSLFAVALALTACQLHALSQQAEWVLGTAVAGRESHELKDQIGFYVNMLPLRCRVDSAESFRNLVRRMGRSAKEALLNQDYPFDDLVRELDPERDPGRQPLFDVVLNLQNFRPLALELKGVHTVLLQDRSVSSKYDLMFMIDDVEALDLYLEYATDLYSEESATDMAQGLVDLSKAAVLSPDISLQELLAPWTPAPPASDARSAPRGVDPQEPPAPKQLEDNEW